jgi:hypothetical protein
VNPKLDFEHVLECSVKYDKLFSVRGNRLLLLNCCLIGTALPRFVCKKKMSVLKYYVNVLSISLIDDHELQLSLKEQWGQFMDQEENTGIGEDYEL